MLIRKIFKAEMAHVVRHAVTQRCAHNVHGHSFKFEIFLGGEKPDRGQMLTDFSVVKKYIGDFLDSFDHSLFIWDQDSEFITFAVSHFERVIVMPFSSSCEMLSKFIFEVISELLKDIPKENGEGELWVEQVIVHETDSGYALYHRNYGNYETPQFPKTDFAKMFFSEGIRKDWDTDWHKQILDRKNINPNLKWFEKLSLPPLT